MDEPVQSQQWGFVRSPNGWLLYLKMEYFPHDYNVRSNDKIKALVRKHGMVGYGVFWSIVEDLYNNANAMRLDCDGIAYDLRVDSEMVKSIIHDFGLFEIDGGLFGSLSVEKRLNERDSKSRKASESAHKRWNSVQSQCEGDATAMQSQCDRNAIKESKGKESKVKEKKEKEIKEKKFISPSLEDFKNYFQENGFDLAVAERAWKGYEVADWHDSQGTKVKNWKQKCQNVWFRPENKTSGPPKINAQLDVSNKIVGGNQAELARQAAIRINKIEQEKASAV